MNIDDKRQQADERREAAGWGPVSDALALEERAAAFKKQAENSVLTSEANREIYAELKPEATEDEESDPGANRGMISVADRELPRAGSPAGQFIRTGDGEELLEQTGPDQISGDDPEQEFFVVLWDRGFEKTFRGEFYLSQEEAEHVASNANWSDTVKAAGAGAPGREHWRVVRYVGRVAGAVGGPVFIDDELPAEHPETRKPLVSFWRDVDEDSGRPAWVWQVRYPNNHVSKYTATTGQLIWALKDAAGNPDRGLSVEVLAQGKTADERLREDLAVDPGGDGGIGAQVKANQVERRRVAQMIRDCDEGIIPPLPESTRRFKKRMAQTELDHQLRVDEEAEMQGEEPTEGES